MRLHIITTLAVITLVFGATAQDGKKIDQLTDHMINELKKFDTTDYKHYRSMFISLKEVHVAIDEMDVPDEEKVEMHNRMTADFIEEYTTEEFRRISRQTRNTGINWKNIVYEDFLYEVRRQRGLKEIKGDLYFQEGDKHYEIKIQAVLTDGEFKPVEIERFRESFDLHGTPEGYESEAEMEAEELVRQMEEALEEAMAEEAAEEVDYQEEQELINRMEEMESDENGDFHEMHEPIPPIDETKPNGREEIEPVANYEERDIHPNPEQQAEFPGGAAALQKFISKNIRYPEYAIEHEISGKVFIEFVVEKDGTLTNYAILKAPHEVLEEEAVRLIRAMPAWTPAKDGGYPVRSKMIVPLTFEMM